MMNTSDDNTESHSRKYVSVIALSRMVNFSVQFEFRKRRSAREYTPSLRYRRHCNNDFQTLETSHEITYLGVGVRLLGRAFRFTGRITQSEYYRSFRVRGHFTQYLRRKCTAYSRCTYTSKKMRLQTTLGFLVPITKKLTNQNRRFHFFYNFFEILHNRVILSVQHLVSCD